MLRVALVGLTPIAARRPETTVFGRVNASHAAAYATQPWCQVTAVCDLRSDLVSSFRDVWEDTWPAVAGYTSFGQLLEEARPDLLSVCTPDDHHADLVVRAAAAGVRGILCEKPLATSLTDADAMLAAVSAAGAALVVHHNRRFDPLFHVVRDVIRLGDIGEPRHLRCYHSGPRAMLFRNGCQAIDMLCFLADSPVVEVAGRLEPGFEHWDCYRGDGGHQPLSEPTATARLQFANGLTGGYDGVRATHAALWCDVIGSEGTIRLFNRHAELVTARSTQALVPPPFDTVGLGAAVAELVRLVTRGGPSMSPPAAARHTVEVLLGILASSQAGGAPVTLPLAPPAAGTP